MPPADFIPSPGCACGKRWTDTPQGWAAADRHNDLDLPESGEARRQRQRDRARIKRELIADDPVLAEQQLAYDRQISECALARIKADLGRVQRERAKTEFDRFD